jgi:hypothetical protein
MMLPVPWTGRERHHCPTIGVFSFHCNIWHRILGFVANASRPARRGGPRTRAGSSRSIFRQSRSAKANLARWFVTDAHGSQSARRSNAVDLIAITNQIARSLIPRECPVPHRASVGLQVSGISNDSTEAGSMPRTRVSGWMIVMALRTDGNLRYSMTKNKRSPFVSWTRPLTLRCSTIT